MNDIESRAREYLAEHSEYSEVFGQTFVAVDTLTAMVEFAEQETKELKEQIEKMKCCGNCYYFNNSKNIGIGNLFCDLMNIKREYCENKDHWEFLRG